MAEHRTQGLQIFGVMPEIQPLFNSRYGMTVRCELPGNTEAWYYDNRDNLFSEYGSLHSAGFGDFPINDTPDGSDWPDMRLVSHGLEYIPQKEIPVLRFEYQTLTSTWTKEREDVKGSTENGLRTLSRSEVATIDTAPKYDEDDVGVLTITDGGKTLYLAGFEDQSRADDEVQIGRIISRWSEAGILEQNELFREPGIKVVETVFLGVEGTTVGPKIARRIGDFQGFRIISVTNFQDKDGNSIVEGGTNLVNSTPIFTDFTYPGLATLEVNSPETASEFIVRHDFVLDESPATCKVRATLFTFFTDTKTIPVSDETYDGASGLYSPNNYCTIKVQAESDTFDQVIVETQSLRAYRSESDSVSGTILPFALEGVRYIFNGQRIVDSTQIDYSVTIDKGPPDPVGSKWVLDIDSREAFEDIDGNTYYKKTIIVTDTIPPRVSGELPYDG